MHDVLSRRDRGLTGELGGALQLVSLSRTSAATNPHFDFDIAAIVAIECIDPRCCDLARSRVKEMFGLRGVPYRARYTPLTLPGGSRALVCEGVYSKQCVDVSLFWRMVELTVARALLGTTGKVIVCLGAHTGCADLELSLEEMARHQIQVLAEARARFSSESRVFVAAVVHDMGGMEEINALVPKEVHPELLNYPLYRVVEGESGTA